MTGKVLIIDDEEKLRTLLARIIKLEGFTVTEAGNLKAGHKTIEREDPDVILCDVKLPDGNGVDFIKEVKTKHPLIEIIIGSSKPLTDAIALAKKVAPTDATVLLLGETGTGKEVFAQSIHAAGNRAGKPFMALNCSSFSKDLLESEIFGHK